MMSRAKGSRAMKEVETKFRVVDASFVAAGAGVESLTPPVLPEIAFAGRSNVGKSSLLNMLLQRNKLVRTSSSPGCTKTLNLFHAKLSNGIELGLVDLPGYGYAKISRAESKSFKAMVEGYLARRPSLVALVVLVDARRGLETEEQELVTFMHSVGKGARARPVTVIVCATKTDKLTRAERKPALDKIEQDAGANIPKVLGVSAVTEDGREMLWQKLVTALSSTADQAAPSLV